MKEEKGEHCLICNSWIPDFEYEYCCSGRECGCMGMPIEPAVCSKECWDKLMKNDKNE